jgi:hypothetical protein
MTRLLRGAAVAVALVVAAPVWAQGQMTAEELNCQELHRLATITAPPVAAAPAFIPDPVGLIVAGGIRPSGPSFPGLLPLVGYGIGAIGVALDVVLMGGPRE